MSSDDYIWVNKVGERYYVGRGFTSDEEMPSHEGRRSFASLNDALAYAHSVDANDAYPAEYGVMVIGDARRELQLSRLEGKQ